MRRPSPLTKSVPAVAIAGLLALAGCGSDSTSDPAPPPSDPDAPVSGTLRTFTYSDTASDVILAPFRKQNPDLDLKTATFDSVQEGSAKIAGGYETDVVQACTDEYQPLLARDLLRPIDPKGITAWDDLDFRDNEGVQRSDGLVNFVPIAAGPQGILYNTDEVDPPPDSWADLFDPEYAGRTTIDGGTWLTPLAEAAFAMGIENPMKMTDEQVEDAKQYLIDHRDQFRSYADSDADKFNLFKSGEVVIADGGRWSRGSAASGRTAGRVGRPRRGDSRLGLRARDHLRRGEHPGRLQADQLLHLRAGPGDDRRRRTTRSPTRPRFPMSRRPSGRPRTRARSTT